MIKNDQGKTCERPSTRVFSEVQCEPPCYRGITGSKLQELEKSICCLQEEINKLRGNLTPVLNPRHNMPEIEQKDCIKQAEESEMSNYITSQNRMVLRLIDDIRNINTYVEV